MPPHLRRPGAGRPHLRQRSGVSSRGGREAAFTAAGGSLGSRGPRLLGLRRRVADRVGDASGAGQRNYRVARQARRQAVGCNFFDMSELLPLFPLSTVLFPGMRLPLHIFEERYRLLVADLRGAARAAAVRGDRDPQGPRGRRGRRHRAARGRLRGRGPADHAARRRPVRPGHRGHRAVPAAAGGRLAALLPGRGRAAQRRASPAGTDRPRPRRRSRSRPAGCRPGSAPT